MKILEENPPNIDIIKRHFPIYPQVVYTYGDTLYNPSKAFISDHLMIHEEVHAKQQGNDPDDWWNKYIKDRSFRLDQELEAYRTQYQFICKHIKDRNKRMPFLWGIANTLSSPLYGNLVNKQKAIKLIQNGKR